MRPINSPDERQLDAMLSEARAQYAAHPSDYLEGVVIALLGLLDLAPDRRWCKETKQAENAVGRPPAARVRDYLNGRQATLAWAGGEAPNPPISIVLTKGTHNDTE